MSSAIGSGSPVATLAPIALVTLCATILAVPLRWSATALVFLLLALDRLDDAAGIWSTPLAPLGQFLSDASGTLTGVKIAGFEAIIALLLALALYRKVVGSTIDDRSGGRVASAVRDLLLVYVVGLAYAVAVGVLRGGSVPPWKVRYILHVPLFFVFFQVAFKDAIAFVPIGRAVVVAAHIKALIAAWVQLVAAPELTGGPLAFATNHGDSVLFVMAVVIVVSHALEHNDRWAWARMLLFLPLPVWGIVLNQRRLAWAMLELTAVLVFFISPWRAWKRKLARSVLVAAPVLALYVGVGWNSSGGGIFGPVHKIRTLVDSSVDASTLWREIEAWNIARTIEETSLLGIGLGGEYTEYMKNDDISAGYADYRRWPHNTVLGLVLYAGLFGFLALWLPFPLTIYLAARAYHRAAGPNERVIALACVGAIVCVCVTAWGDTGLHFTQAKLAASLALAAAGRLAVSSGAWPARIQVDVNAAASSERSA